MRAHTHVSIARLDGDQTIALAQAAGQFAKADKGLFTIGAACAGSNVIMHAVGMTATEMYDISGQAFRPYLVFSAEMVKWKRTFSDIHWAEPCPNTVVVEKSRRLVRGARV